MVLFRVWLNGLWFGIRNVVLNYHDRTLFLSWIFMITERKKNQWIYQWIFVIQIIWKLSYVNLLRSIAFELFERWTILIVFLFLALILSIWLTTKPKWFKKILFSNFRKTWLNLHLCGKVPIKSVLFACPSVHPSVTHFSQNLIGGFS